MSQPRNHRILLGLFGFCGAMAWAFYALALRHEAGPDWMVFYTGARLYWDGNLPLLFDGARFTAAINAQFAGWLAKPLDFLPWVNPPQFLFFVLPFALLPFALAYASFELASIAALLAALRLWADERARWSLAIFALLFCPATAFTIFVGQSSFLTAALLVAGLALLPKRPLVAGVLLGLLAYKPQFCLMLPFALLAGRHYRAIASGLATAALLIGASILLVGVEPWRQWLDFARGTGALYQHWSVTARLTDQSVYGCLFLLGAPPFAATAAQMLAIAFAAVAVAWCFHRPMPAPTRAAVALIATLLAAPHVSTADGLLAPVAAILLLIGAGERPARGEIALIVLLWLSPVASPPQLLGIGFAIPLLLAGALATLGWRGGAPRRNDNGVTAYS